MLRSRRNTRQSPSPRRWEEPIRGGGAGAQGGGSLFPHQRPLFPATPAVLTQGIVSVYLLCAMPLVAGRGQCGGRKGKGRPYQDVEGLRVLGALAFHIVRSGGIFTGGPTSYWRLALPSLNHIRFSAMCASICPGEGRRQRGWI